MCILCELFLIAMPTNSTRDCESIVNVTSEEIDRPKAEDAQEKAEILNSFRNDISNLLIEDNITKLGV